MIKKIILIAMLFLPIMVNAEITNQEEFITAIGGPESAEIINNKITLKKDVTIKEEIITDTGTYLIDLNGYTIKDDETSTFPRGNILFFDNSKVTIENSKNTGGITTQNDSRIILASNSELNIKNIKINGNGTPLFATGSKLTVTGGEYTSKGSAGIYAASTTVNLTDIKVTGKNEGISLQDCDSIITKATVIATGEENIENNQNSYGLIIGLGNATINSGYFEGPNAGLLIYGNSVTLKEGHYKSTMSQENNFYSSSIGAIINHPQDSDKPEEDFNNMIDKNLVISQLTISQGKDYDFNEDIIYTNQEVIMYYPKLTNNLYHLTNTGSNEITKNSEYKTTLSADKGYMLPENIIVKVGNKEITEGYTYNNKTGEVIIEDQVITDNVEIVAIAIKIVNDEQKEEIKNPETYDNIIICFILAIISLTILLISHKYTKNLQIKQ